MASVQYLDLTGLNTYDSLIKQYIDDADASSIKGVGLSSDGKSLLFYKEEPISGATASYSIELPVTDISNLMALVTDAVANNIAIYDSNGQVIDSGKALTDFATAEQGALAESAVQSVTTGTANGTISVDGNNVSVMGLGSAAYTDSTSYDAAGAAAEVLGTSTDAAGTATVYGALASAAEASTAAETAQTTATNAQTAVDELEAYVGTIPEGYSATTIAEYAKELADNVAANGYDDTALTTRVSTLESAVETLNGDESTEGSVAKTVADAISDATTEITTAYTTAIANADHLKRTIVSTLPDVGDADENTIYMVAKESGSGDQNYDEYMLINGAFEKIGDSTVDLTNYATIDYVDSTVSDAIDTAASDATTKANAALESAQAYTDDKVTALAEGQVATNTADIEDLKSSINDISAIATADIEALFA